MRISEYFNLGVKQNELDFVDVNTTTDIKLFIDPCRIHVLDNKWCQEASNTIRDFFNHILNLYEQGQYEEAKRFFDNGHEPNETCFGLSANAPGGTGTSPEMLNEVFDNILKTDMIDNGLIKNLEDVYVFVENFGEDRLSDLVTNLIRKHLVEFTKKQCLLHDIEINNEDRNLPHYWDVNTHNWVQCNESPLIIDGKDILLVPKEIAVKNYKFTASQYCTHYVLERRVKYHYENNTHLVRREPKKNGEVIPKVYKTEVKEEEIKNSELNEKQYIRLHTENEPTLIQRFRDDIAGILLDPSRTNELSDEMLEQMLNEL